MLSKNGIIELYKKHHRELFVYLSRFTADQEVAEDLLHDTFEQLIRYSQNKEIEERTVRAFLYRTAHNLAVNHHLRLKNRTTIRIEDFSESLAARQGEEMTERISKEELSRHIERYLSTLDAEGRSMFIMHKELGKTYDEIAESLHMSSRTVRRRMKHIVEQIVGELEKRGFSLKE